MSFHRRLVLAALAFALVRSLCGCGLFSAQGGGQDQPETLGGVGYGWVYLNEATGEALQVDPAGIAYSGTLADDTLTVTGVYAYTRAGRTVRLYRVALPHLVVDFTVPTWEFRQGLLGPSFVDRIGDYVNQYQECRLVYDAALAQADGDLSLSLRPELWAVALAARDDPPVAATFAPEPIVEDVGQPVANSRVTREDYYGRSTLTDGERAVYDAAYDGISSMQPEIDVAALGVSVDDARRILDYVQNDAPELFWWSGMSVFTHRDGVVQAIAPRYGYSAQEARRMQVRVDAAAAEILAPVNGGMSEYQKAVYISGELGRRVTYDQASADRIAASPADAVADPANHDHQTIVGGLVDGLALCTGITRSYQYLLGRVGILALCVTGTLLSPSDGAPLGAHAWNLIRIDGEWYYADLTNALPAAAAAKFDDFMRSDRDIGADYVFRLLNDADDPGDDVNENPPLPACTSDRFDGDVRRHLVLGAFGDGELDHLKNVIYGMMQSGTCQAAVTFADRESLGRAAELLARDGAAIARDIPACGGVALCDVDLIPSSDTVAWLRPVYVQAPENAP